MKDIYTPPKLPKVEAPKEDKPPLFHPIKVSEGKAPHVVGVDEEAGIKRQRVMRKLGSVYV